MMSKISILRILIAFGVLTANEGIAGNPFVYKCTSHKGESGIVLTKLPNDENMGYYLDALNQGKWKLERPGKETSFISVQFLILNKDKAVQPIGSPAYSCSGEHEKLNVYINVAERITVGCSGPGCILQFKLLSSLNVE